MIVFVVHAQMLAIDRHANVSRASLRCSNVGDNQKEIASVGNLLENAEVKLLGIN